MVTSLGPILDVESAVGTGPHFGDVELPPCGDAQADAEADAEADADNDFVFGGGGGRRAPSRHKTLLLGPITVMSNLAWAPFWDVESYPEMAGPIGHRASSPPHGGKPGPRFGCRIRGGDWAPFW